MTVDRRELASYDTYGAGTYILDEGDYYLTVATDAHNAVNNILAAKGYTVDNTDGRMDTDGNSSLTYKYNNPKFDSTTYAVPQTEQKSKISFLMQISICMEEQKMRLHMYPEMTGKEHFRSPS